MITITRKLLPLTLAAGLLAGCASDSGQKQTVGGILGGVGGAVAGAQFGKGTGQIAATAAGTLLGAYLGSEVGKSLDKADQAAAQRASHAAFETAPSGQPVTWNNPDSGHSGTVTPTRTYYEESTPCREYQTTVTIDGKTERAYGTACRQPDGTWKVVK